MQMFLAEESSAHGRNVRFMEDWDILQVATEKMIRKQLEKNLGVNLGERKAFIREQVGTRIPLLISFSQRDSIAHN